MTFHSLRTWLLAGGAIGILVCPVPADADDGESLLARHAQLQGLLRQNAFGRPLVLDSLESAARVQGQIHAVVNYPFAVVRTGLDSPASWCDVMSLHANTKYCRVAASPGGTRLNLNIGKKTAEELRDAPRVEFLYTTVAATARYLNITLSAATGPLGTRDYRIELQAIPISPAQTFMYLSYSYSANGAARLAMSTYLATAGHGKVGFTSTAQAGGGAPEYVGGIRGLMERNTMRYYLAIDSFLEATTAAPSAQLERRLQSWFTAVEQYPRQLHEMDRNAYVTMKRDEYLRQQKAE